MEKYQIIPRKFRPKRFSEVASHETIVTTLQNALKQHQVAQAYLFCGARGCGKTTLARLFAKALNCSNLTEDFEPCNACTSCIEISSGRNLDIIEIDGASNRGIDDIRQLNETVGYAASKGHYKIYIIDEVHMLTKEAFNALLKTLEEPPKNVKFFFATTEPHKLPPTIISRCQRFNLMRIPQSKLVEKLERIASELGIAVDQDALVQISDLSEGSLRDAESLLDQLICFGQTPITLELTRSVFGLLSNEHLFELDEAILANQPEKGAQIALSLYESGKDIQAVIDGLLDHYRTYLQSHLGRKTQEKYAQFSSRFTQKQLTTLLDSLIQWQTSMAKIPFKAVHLEMLLVNLVRSAHKISLDTLIERLLELEARLDGQAVSPPLVQPKQHVEPVKSEEPKPTLKQPPPSQKSSAHPSKYDTLIRFAAVELEGSYERS